MTREEMANRVWMTAHTTAGEIEDFLGEFDEEQKIRVTGALIGFWCAHEDGFHPPRDGEKWIDFVKRTCI